MNTRLAQGIFNISGRTFPIIVTCYNIEAACIPTYIFALVKVYFIINVYQL